MNEILQVRFRTDEYVGPVMIHCHLTKDEDQGMMMVAQIDPKGWLNLNFLQIGL